MAGHTFSCGRQMASPTEVSLFCGRLMAGCTFSCGRLAAGLTEVSPFDSIIPLWAPNGWSYLLLWAPDGWLHGGSHTQILSPLWVPYGWPQLLLWAPDGWTHRGSHPHQFVFLRRPTSFLSVLTAPIFLSILVEGVYGWTISPTPTSAVLPISAADTSTTSAAKSGTALCLRVSISAPVPGSPVGCLSSDTVKITLFIHRIL